MAGLVKLAQVVEESRAVVEPTLARGSIWPVVKPVPIAEIAAEKDESLPAMTNLSPYLFIPWANLGRLPMGGTIPRIA
jgi:hypothetical protein